MQNMLKTEELQKTLLKRNSLCVIDDHVRAFYHQKSVLITGGGGSVGSEICSCIAQCHPSRIVIFDIYENNAFMLSQRLSRLYKDEIEICVEVGSVQDKDCVEALFAKYDFDVVFHAAAHKHVHLMENNPAEAVKNNVFGTYILADAAERHSCDRFILISTDKAINPVSVMGATKRLCEMITSCRSEGKTSFSAVRFCNVFASEGSVIPLFRSQIEEGGPILITDKRMTRYFMTVTEAAQLLMAAGAMASRGELYALNIGEKVNMYELAKALIQAEGHEPDGDIKIIETGARPGERLSEELFLGENLVRTENELIYIEKEQPLTREAVDEKMKLLLEAVNLGDSGIIKKTLTETVPTYTAL